MDTQRALVLGDNSFCGWPATLQTFQSRPRDRFSRYFVPTKDRLSSASFRRFRSPRSTDADAWCEVSRWWQPAQRPSQSPRNRGRSRLRDGARRRQNSTPFSGSPPAFPTGCACYYPEPAPHKDWRRTGTRYGELAESLFFDAVPRRHFVLLDLIASGPKSGKVPVLASEGSRTSLICAQ
jgi:hypothetical protein